MSLIDDPKHITPKAAAYVSASPRTLENWRQQGKGPKYLKIGRSVVYLESDLEAWLQSQRRSSTSER